MSIEFLERHRVSSLYFAILSSSRGQHQVLRFAVSTPNVGAGDLVIGNPTNCSVFFTRASAGHLHYEEFADYRLWTQA